MMRPAISCATTIGGTRRSYSRSFRQTSRCASAFATFLSEVRRWSRSMGEARPITTTRRRIAGWLRAIRGIAGTYNAVQAQAPELQELRQGVEGLARSHREMISQNTAKLDATAKQVADAREQISKMLDGMKDVVAAQHAFTAAHATTAGTAIDVGCGRGEWLELMRDAGIRAVGVDENALVVDQCTELGLDAVHGDAISYLAHVPEQTAAAITAFHVIEHLPL